MNAPLSISPILIAISSIYATGFGNNLQGSELPSANTPITGIWQKHIITEKAQSSINSAVFHDWNHDGLGDVLSSLEGKVILYTAPDWKPHTIHTFSEDDSQFKPKPACIHSCLMDVDSDGDLDFIGSNNSVFWLECPDEPLSGKPWTYSTIDDEIRGTHCLTTADIDQDGSIDLIANSGSPKSDIPNSICWLSIPKNPHDATSWPRNVFADKDAPGGSHYMGIGDVNKDGRLDISCAAKGGEKHPDGEWFAWWEQPEDPKGSWKKHLLSDQQVGATNIIPSDLNGDGHMDFFATRGHGKGAIWFKGPEMELIEIDSAADSLHSLAIVDLDQDGDLDAVSCGKELTGCVLWYENNGHAVFKRRLIDKFQASYDTRCEDIDGDGDLDILIAGHFSKNIVWYENPLKGTSGD